MWDRQARRELCRDTEERKGSRSRGHMLGRVSPGPRFSPWQVWTADSMQGRLVEGRLDRPIDRQTLPHLSHSSRHLVSPLA